MIREQFFLPRMRIHDLDLDHKTQDLGLGPRDAGSASGHGTQDLDRLGSRDAGSGTSSLLYLVREILGPVPQGAKPKEQQEEMFSPQALATEAKRPRAHTQLRLARSQARTKRNDFPVAHTPQPPIYEKNM